MKKNRISLLPSIGLVLVGAFLIRLLLHNTLTYTLDLNTFIAWGRRLNEVGFGQFYQQWSDYLPGYLYVLSFVAGIEKILPLSSTLLYKLPAILADVGVGYLIFNIIARKFDHKKALLAASLFLFNPAVIANSTMWGQVDIFTALFSLLSIFLFEKKWFLSAIALAIGTVIKPQAALAAPIILAMMIQKKWRWERIVSYGVVAFVSVLVLFVPYANGNSLLSFIIERFQTTVSQYPYTSVNAFNFWGLGGFWNPDTEGTITASTAGTAITILLAVVVLGFGYIKKINPYYLLALLLTTHFMFFTRMHERHLLPMLAPLIIAAAANRNLWIAYFGFSATYIANLWYAYYWTNNNFETPFPESVTTMLILLNLGLLLFMVQTMFTKLKLKWESNTDVMKVVEKPVKHGSKILIAILIFTAITRLVSLQNPSQEYFDEVYHAFTARIVADGDPKAWEWWNPHPEGYAYEWTHPPFAKLAMAGSMLVLGQNSFAWRLPAALFGVGVVYMVYLIGRRLFNSQEIGLIAAGLISLEGLVLVLSRIGMNDIYLLFFCLLCFYAFLKEKYVFAAIAFGFALSAKWSAVWLLPLLGITFLAYRRKLKLGLLSFAIFPPIIYLASYFPMFVTGHDLETWWGMQKQMWWYHTGLEAEHAYTSPWWSWPLNLRPVWLYVNRVSDTVANIYAMGNPVLLWGGLVGIVMGFYELFLKKNKSLALAIFGWLIFFIPWAASPRIMFFYHYLPAIPFLMIVLAYNLAQNRTLLKVFMLISLIIFIYFYPHWTGIVVPTWLSDSYFWLESWR